MFVICLIAKHRHAEIKETCLTFCLKQQSSAPRWGSEYSWTWRERGKEKNRGLYSSQPAEITTRLTQRKRAFCWLSSGHIDVYPRESWSWSPALLFESQFIFNGLFQGSHSAT